MTTTPLHTLAELGQSPWIDYVSREMLRTGKLERMMREDAINGVTSNPTIFQKAIAAGDDYDEQLQDELHRTADPKEIFWALAERDIRQACDQMRAVWDDGAGRSGWVSLEVDPNLSGDTGATIAEAQKLSEVVDRPNLFVKIPATRPGLGAIQEMIGRGVPINVTLIFSLARHREVAEAYLAGLEKLAADGGNLRAVASVASFFVSRVDTEADRRLEEAGAPQLRGKLAIANAKLAYQQYLEVFSGERWEALRAKGANPQRCLWASTSTKNPAYRDVLYVEELIGPETVNTMPEETILAFADHGRAERTLDQGVDEAHKVLEDVEAAGVSYDDVVETLEREGVQKFAESFSELLDGIAAKREALAAA
jgi:transaldolase